MLLALSFYIMFSMTVYSRLCPREDSSVIGPSIVSFINAEISGSVSVCFYSVASFFCGACSLYVVM